MTDIVIKAFLDTLAEDLPPEAKRFYKNYNKHKNIEAQSLHISELKQELAIRDRIIQETVKTSNSKINELLENAEKERILRNIGLIVGVVGIIIGVLGFIF